MIAAMLLLVAQVAGPTIADIRGEWVNQHGTAIVRIADCPTGLCGSMIWSEATAQRDAARGGTAEFDGTVVMSSFVPTWNQLWRGKLFLPDQGRMVKATIELRDNDWLQVSACGLGGLVCKTQRWSRRSAS